MRINEEPLESGENADDLELNGVAVIGMAGRFPGAGSIDEFWENLVNGVDSIRFYKDEELIEAGVEPGALNHPDYVKAKGEVGNVDMFDASFFGINPREAEVTDPQHRMLLECAWEAMEHAGYDSGKYDGPIGVYAGKSMDYYLLLNVYPYIKKEISAGSLQAAIGNDKDSLTTLISYRLNLTGPAITIQTSSSTSLVAICVACQSLLTYQCDIALAGGITAGPPIKSGYLYQEGGIWAPDGHCRAFSAGAKGFVPGCGMGLTVLKRLEDAVREGDTIWAVIKGFAVNNDGSNKVSYSAPSVDAQAVVVAQAQAAAGVHPETIQYIETHGTGTHLGDPIEITALTQAFRARTDKKHFCAVGSVKSNLGHLDNAAGAAGLIKVALSLKHREIPASLHFDKPNPGIDFENSPFFVNTETREWITGGTPRRAGVTSLGMGGTNAHVILEEAPEPGPPGESREWQLLMLSAKTPAALEEMTGNLLDYLRENSVNAEKPGFCLADAAYTLQVGRRDFNRRRVALCRDAGFVLENLTPGLLFGSGCEFVNRPVVFMFSGQGAQYVNMGKGLYESEPVFKENMDTCAGILEPLLGMDLRGLIQADTDNAAGVVYDRIFAGPYVDGLGYSAGGNDRSQYR
jgi:acyl transferase domain-containing protein